MTDWQIRPYKEGDLPAIAANWTASFAADGLDIVIGKDEMLSTFTRPGFDPFCQVLVIEGTGVGGVPEGMLASSAWLDMRDEEAAGERIYGIHVIAHEAARPLGLERVLAQRLMGMIRQREEDPTTPHREKVRVHESFSTKQESQRKLYTEMGMREVRIFWTMECPLDDLPEPQPVEGVTMRVFERPKDILPSLDALNNSFLDHYDFQPRSLERWEHRVNTPSFRGELSWVAEIDAQPGKLAGFCLCGILDEENRSTGRLEGWIETLGTIRGWRGKGLGRALLLHGLHSLKAAGMKIGMLGVDSINPTGATRLYESVGFRVRDTWLNYECLLEEVKI
jgi:mycothiol synthase